ncbi:MAG: S8/S53 family peptidase [Acidobacteriaceae bacterium]|nr:S8/S53 family peptidase [Acidobacteriaceae bacterium]
MAFDKFIQLPGSERNRPPNATASGPVPGTETVRVSVILHRRNEPEIDPRTGAFPPISREEFAELYGADPEDIRTLLRFAHRHGLSVVESSAVKRRVVLTGSASAMTAAFGTQLTAYRSAAGQTFRARTGSLSIPEELGGAVMAVLGMDTREVARAHFRMRAAAAAVGGTFTPPQVAEAYNFPTGVTGAGQTIGIIELGGGYTASDLQTFFSGLGLSEPNVTAVSVDGGQNSPGSESDGEVELDIEVAGSIANGADIAVYFTPNTDQGFIDAVTDAVHDTTNHPSVISISWGGPEDSWTQQSQTALNSALEDGAMLGVTVTVAAGDNGSSDGDSDGQLHVDFPASSPYVVACGGTTLTVSGETISSEVVWNETANNEGATGGGVSNVFQLPSYQSSAGVPAQPETGFAGRGVPDVAANADPQTGYEIVVDGQSAVVGGTSACAPLWAGLFALINQSLGKNVGYVNAALYSIPEADYHDITSGNNDDSGLGYYSAGPGWDPCTGLGSPDGAAILSALEGTTTTGGAGTGGTGTGGTGTGGTGTSSGSTGTGGTGTGPGRHRRHRVAHHGGAQ